MQGNVLVEHGTPVIEEDGIAQFHTVLRCFSPNSLLRDRRAPSYSSWLDNSSKISKPNQSLCAWEADYLDGFLVVGHQS